MQRTISLSIISIALILSMIIIYGIDSSSTESPELVIMTFNVLVPRGLINNTMYSWQDRISVGIDIIERYDPDFIGLQEAHKEQLDILLSSKYDFIGQGNRGLKGEYGAILYNKYRFIVLENGTLWLSPTPNKPSTGWGSDTPRMIVWALFLDKYANKKVMIANTHLEQGSGDAFTARRESIKLFLDRIWPKMKEERYYAFIGDFNMRNGGLPIDNRSKWQVESEYLWKVLTGKEYLDGKQATLVDAWDIASKKVNDRATIDWILLSNNFDVIEVINLEGYSKDGIPATDHSPVIAIVKYN